jgi:hypothetical protein
MIKLEQDHPVARSPGRRPAGALIAAALEEKRLGIRTLAAMRADETHPDLSGAARSREVQNRRRQIQKWLNRAKEGAPPEPVEWVEPENAGWLSRILEIPYEDLVRPALTEEDRILREVERARAHLAEVESRLRRLQRREGPETP